MIHAGPHTFHALRGAEGARVAGELRPWLDTGLLQPAEIALAARLAALVGPPRTPLVLAFALALRADRQGSALVDLAAVDVNALLAEREHPPAGEEVAPQPPLPWDAWREALRAHPALIACREAGAAWAGAPVRTPFVLEGSRLYTARAWADEARVAGGVHRLHGGGAAPRGAAEGDDAAPPGGASAGVAGGASAGVAGGASGGAVPDGVSPADWAPVEAAVLALIRGQAGEGADAEEQRSAEEGAERQRAAARSAVAAGRLQVVTGGPGTGKTFTVRAMLTLAWLARALAGEEPPALDVQLAAPTGKAAQRMKEAMGAGLGEWCAAVEAALAGTALAGGTGGEGVATALERFLAGLRAQTLHRLLGYQHFNPTRFRRSRRDPLAADLVVVDEASMVDLAMMAHLFDAVAEHATLVLVGDRRQLASVDTGTVLADLCAWGEAEGGPLVTLSVSRRFPARSAVGRFAAASEALDGIGEDDAAGLAAAAEAAAAILREAAAGESGEAGGGKGAGRRAEVRGAADAVRGVRVRWLDREADAKGATAAGKQGAGESGAGVAQGDLFAQVQVPGQARVQAVRGAEARELAAELDAVAAWWVEIMVALRDVVFVLGDEGALHLEEPALRHLAGLAGLAADGGAAPEAWKVLSALAERVRVLAAHRKGERGVAGLNAELWRRIEARVRALPEARRPVGVLGRGQADPAVGKPIIVTKNDYGLRRFNGDVGLWVRACRAGEGAEAARTVALFQREGGGVDAHSSARLPEHEVVWAMTVHKSQGSEFEKVVFVLPERSSALWTRELVYTGITRVKGELVLAGAESVLVAGLKQRIRRASGLPERLS